jgi:hypothetical protein
LRRRQGSAEIVKNLLLTSEKGSEKTFFRHPRRGSAVGSPQEKVFWFFFSKKNKPFALRFLRAGRDGHSGLRYERGRNFYGNA